MGDSIDSSGVIGISVERMEAMRRDLERATQAACEARDGLSRTSSSLEVVDGRLRMEAEELNRICDRVSRRIEDIQRTEEHVDYVVRRFQEVDSQCAQRIRYSSYEYRRMTGLAKNGALFGDISGGRLSIVDQGRAAWKWVEGHSKDVLDGLQAGLDIVGMIPGVGEIADGVNAVIYVARGDYATAALSVAAMVPFAGCAATAGKFVYKGIEAYKKTEKVVEIIDKTADAYKLVSKAGNQAVGKVIDRSTSICGDVSQVFGRKLDLVAEGIGAFRGKATSFGKVGIPTLEKNAVQKNYNAIVGSMGKGAGKADDVAAGVSKAGKGIGRSKEVIESRVKGFDLSERPNTRKQLSSKKMQELKTKVDERRITKDEWDLYDWNKRFGDRRDKGVSQFWKQEKNRLFNGEAPTRNWSEEQINDILNNKRPNFNGEALQGHHSYSASKYPHLADKGEVIFPATRREHFNGWHGGNYKDSLPGEPINDINEF